ncbi:MAG: hypothetical protein ACFFEF_12705 [Candidatus Thorarchaeota archaeon]
MANTTQMDTIYDRPRALRIIGLFQMLVGLIGIIAALGLLVATLMGNPQLVDVGYTYALLVFVGIGLPSLVIGNFVDDLRRGAVAAQIFYSLLAVIITGLFLWVYGIGYLWTFPLFNITLDVYIGNLATGILGIQLAFAAYLVTNWTRVAPPPGTKIVRDKVRARLIERGVVPSPLSPRMLAPDGYTELSEEEGKRILGVRKIISEEGMAILCSNCGGATPFTKVERDNTLHCDYCGVHLALSGVFVPCLNHPEYLAATSCSVCGEHYCRRCLTAQEPPVDARWEGSTVFLCQKCFEGRYRPAVTTSSLVIPIDSLFGKAGGRFSKLGQLYAKFLRAYGGIMKWVLYFSLRLLSSMGKSGGKGGGKGGDDAAAGILVIILIIIAIPILVGIALLLAGIVIIPILFYAGLVGVTIEAVKIIRRTDFVSLQEARERGIELGRPADKKESTLRETTRTWDSSERYRDPQQHKVAHPEGLFRR